MTTYAYDVHGDMTSRTQPDAGTTRYKYDRRHNVRFSQNAQQALGGKVSYFTYDRFSRMIRSGEGRGSSPPWTRTGTTPSRLM